MIALGPVLDDVLAAVEGRDVTVLYASTVRPFDGRGLRAALGTPDVVLVEPWLAGTSAHVVAEALRDVPHRLLALGVARTSCAATAPPPTTSRPTGSTRPGSGGPSTGSSRRPPDRREVLR